MKQINPKDLHGGLVKQTKIWEMRLHDLNRTTMAAHDSSPTHLSHLSTASDAGDAGSSVPRTSTDEREVGGFGKVHFTVLPPSEEVSRGKLFLSYAMGFWPWHCHESGSEKGLVPDWEKPLKQWADIKGSQPWAPNWHRFELVQLRHSIPARLAQLCSTYGPTNLPNSLSFDAWLLLVSCELRFPYSCALWVYVGD
jgi:hypothetical protein